VFHLLVSHSRPRIPAITKRQKPTDTLVRSFPIPSEDKGGMVFDSIVHGFAIRVRPSGSRTWVYQFKIGNKSRRMSIGSFPAMPTVKARETAADLAAQVRLGNGGGDLVPAISHHRPALRIRPRQEWRVGMGRRQGRLGSGGPIKIPSMVQEVMTIHCGAVPGLTGAPSRSSVGLRFSIGTHHQYSAQLTRNAAMKRMIL
jgi:Arm DNA-binding domain